MKLRVAIAPLVIMFAANTVAAAAAVTGTAYFLDGDCSTSVAKAYTASEECTPDPSCTQASD